MGEPAKVLPSDGNLLYIFSEDVRLEAGNKLSLLGVFPGGDMGVTGIDPPFDLPSITLLFIFRDGHGAFKVVDQIFGPDGNLIVPPFEGEATKEKTKTLTHAIKLAPFRVNAFGTYKCVVNLDDKQFERAFEIRKTAG